MAEDDGLKPDIDEATTSRRKRPPMTIDLAAEPDDSTPPLEAESQAPPVDPAPQIDFGDDSETLEDPRRADAIRFLPIVGAALGGGIVGGLLVLFLSASGTDPVSEASLDTRMQVMGSRLDGIEADLANRKPAPAVPANTARLDALDQQIASLKAAIAAVPAPVAGAPAEAAPVDLAPLTERLAALESRPVPTATPATDLSPLEGKLDGLIARVDKIEAHPPSDPKTEAAARTIALTSLRQTAASSAPFADELKTVQSLGGDDPALAALSTFAIQGAPSRAALAEAFPALVDQVRQASLQVSPDAGLFDKLAASAGALVSVKPSGPIEGTTTPAIVSRMEAAVKAGDLAAALREADGLDTAAKAPLAEWIAGAGNRVAIDEALSRLNTGSGN